MPTVFRCCLLLVLCSAAANGQPAKDSLLHLIRTLPEDTAKMDVYFSYGELLENTHLDSASWYYEKALEIAGRHNHVKGRIKYNSYHSYVLTMRGKLDEAARVNKESLKLAREHGLELETAKSLTNLGNSHNLRGELDTAVQYYMEAAALFDKLNNRRFLHILYMNIGVAFESLEQHERAIEYLKKSAAQSKLANDSITMMRAFINMGSSLNALDRFDSAVHYLEVALSFTKRYELTYEQHSALINLANSFAQKKRNEEAFDAFQEALELARMMEIPSGMATAMNGMAMVLYDQRHFQRADYYAMEAIRLSEDVESGIFADLRQQYKLLADIKANLGQTKQAFEYLRKYVSLSDSLVGQDVKRMTADLERKYLVAQKDKDIAEKELAIQQAESQVQKKNTQLLLVVGGLLFTLATLFLLYRYFRQRQRLQQEQLRSLQQEQEMIRLRSNLEGQQEERIRIAKEIHDDIGSGLTALVFLTSSLSNGQNLPGSTEKITSIARQLVGQMNEIVWSLNSDQDSLEDLVIYIRHSVSEMLDTVGMGYTFRIPETLPPVRVTGVQRRHIFLAVKEAVHNAIKHARASQVTIDMMFSDEVLTISVEDNGQGIKGDMASGNGLRNMQYRMKQVGGEWKLVSAHPVKLELAVPLAESV